MREETCCRHMGYSFRLAARVLLYAPCHRQDCTYHGLCYTTRGTLAGTRNSSMGPLHEGSIRRPIAPWANALTTELHLASDLGRCYYRYHIIAVTVCTFQRSSCNLLVCALVWCLVDLRGGVWRGGGGSCLIKYSWRWYNLSNESMNEWNNQI